MKVRKQAAVLAALMAICGGLGLTAGTPAQGQKASQKGVCTGMWLEHTPGATTVVTEIKNGVEARITSADPAVAAKLQADAPDYYAKKKDTNCDCCAAAQPGAATVVENIENGIKVMITAKTPALVKTIRAKSATMVHPPAAKKDLAAKKAKKSARWVCPIGEYEGDKPGKCPKCGMTLVEKK